MNDNMPSEDSQKSHDRAEKLTFKLIGQFAEEGLSPPSAFIGALTTMLLACFDMAPNKAALIGLLGVAITEAFDKMEKED